MRNLKTLTLFTALSTAALMLGGCNSSAKSDSHADPGSIAAPTSVAVISHQHGQQSAVAAPTLRHITSAEQFKALGLADAKPANFKTQDMILVGLGEQPTGGYWVHITQVFRVGDEIVVQATVNRPGEGDMTTQALTQPYCIATTAKLGKVTLSSDFTSVAGQQQAQ